MTHDGTQTPPNLTGTFRAPPPHVETAVRAACATTGLDPSGASVLHDHANTVLLLPAENLVARLSAGDHREDASHVLAVVRWLLDQNFPASIPLNESHPVLIESQASVFTVTFWVYHPQPVEWPRPDSAHLGEIVRSLHGASDPPMRLRRWLPLDTLEKIVSDPAMSPALPSTDRDWLLHRIDTLRTEIDSLDWPLGHGLIHADAWAGNLLWDTSTTMTGGSSPVTDVRLGDWDSVCHGPREVDLIPSWHAAYRYGRGAEWPQNFALKYGYNLSEWSGFSTLLEMRDLAQLGGPLRHAHYDKRYARALRQRLDGSRSRKPGSWLEF
ncbi:phosphotransferase [Saccharothrix sp. Mg75]|uniref:phosphotransferase n=1 Tax=Saccharothrix sp. Mg75 TaxID=3445357 RepID=UPI003EE9B712